jgi:hypothetical protein
VIDTLIALVVVYCALRAICVVIDLVSECALAAHVSHRRGCRR